MNCNQIKSYVYVDRYSHLVPSLQMMQFSAAAGLSRLLIILGMLKPLIQGDGVSEEILQLQVSPQGPSEPGSFRLMANRVS